MNIHLLAFSVANIKNPLLALIIFVIVILAFRAASGN